MKNWVHLPAVTQRQMAKDLKMALSSGTQPATQLADVARIIDLYEAIGTLTSVVPTGKTPTVSDLHVTLRKMRAEMAGSANLASLNRIVDMLDNGNDDDDDDEEEDERPDGYLPSASTGDERADQQYVEYNLLWREARNKLVSDPDVFSVTAEKQGCVTKFIGLALVAQERVVREARATLSLHHRRLRTSRSSKREKVVLAMGEYVDHLVAIHTEHKAKRTK